MCSSIGSRSSSLAGRAICPLRSASDLNEGDVACQKSPKRVIFPSLPTSPLPLPLPSPLPLLLFPPPSPSHSPPSPPPLPSSLIPTERERKRVYVFAYDPSMLLFTAPTAMRMPSPLHSGSSLEVSQQPLFRPSFSPLCRMAAWLGTFQAAMEAGLRTISYGDRRCFLSVQFPPRCFARCLVRHCISNTFSTLFRIAMNTFSRLVRNTTS